jgi:hypothetical protein
MGSLLVLPVLVHVAVGAELGSGASASVSVSVEADVKTRHRDVVGYAIEAVCPSHYVAGNRALLMGCSPVMVVVADDAAVGCTHRDKHKAEVGDYAPRRAKVGSLKMADWYCPRTNHQLDSGFSGRRFVSG